MRLISVGAAALSALTVLCAVPSVVDSRAVTGAAVADTPADTLAGTFPGSSADPDADIFTATDPDLLATLTPGTPTVQREATVHVVGIPTALSMTQVRYRTTDVLGNPAEAVTSILHPPGTPSGKTVLYASFYDSMRPEDGPSRILAGSVTPGGRTVPLETGLVQPLLQDGHSVVMPDVQGERGIFAVGPEYGQVTLDALRAAHRTPEAGVAASSPTVLAGYSGGAIAASWAGMLAPEYAPELVGQLRGVSQGATMVTPENNLAYVGEGAGWSGVVGMARAGIARAYGEDLDPYLTEFGKEVVAQFSHAGIEDATDTYEHLRWSELFLPEYPTPASIPRLQEVLDALDMMRRPAPVMPQLLMQAGGGESGKTPVHPTLGDGDGVMLLGDAQRLADRWKDAGTEVDYREMAPVGHLPGGALWAAETLDWVGQCLAD